MTLQWTVNSQTSKSDTALDQDVMAAIVLVREWSRACEGQRIWVTNWFPIHLWGGQLLNAACSFLQLVWTFAATVCWTVWKGWYSYRLKSSVRMVRKASWLFHSKLIQHQERIQVPQLEIKHVVIELQKVSLCWGFRERDEMTTWILPPSYRCSCGHEHQLPLTAPHSKLSLSLSSRSLCWKISHWKTQARCNVHWIYISTYTFKMVCFSRETRGFQVTLISWLLSCLWGLVYYLWHHTCWIHP